MLIGIFRSSRSRSNTHEFPHARRRAYEALACHGMVVEAVLEYLLGWELSLLNTNSLPTRTTRILKQIVNYILLGTEGRWR